MKRYGKITVGLVLTMALVVAWMLAQNVIAAQHSGVKTFVLPTTDSVTHDTNTYLIIYDLNTGDLVDATTGIADSGNAWGDCDIATAVHAENGVAWVATIPTLNLDYDYVMVAFSNATPAKTDTPTWGPFLYDAKYAMTYSDASPIRDGRVRTWED